MEASKNIKNVLKSISKEYTYIIVFILLFIISVIVNPNFAQYSNITNIFKQSAIMGILSLAMGMIIISGNIDLSIGASVCMISAVGIEVLNATQSIMFMIIFCIVFGIFISLINGFIVAKFRVPAFIGTLSTMMIFRATTQYFARSKMGGQYIVDTKIFESFRTLAGGSFITIPYLGIFFIVIATIIIYIMESTKIGKFIYAVGGNEKAAKLAGINVTAVRIIVFAISGVLIGIASVLFASRLSAIQPASAGVGFELDAIAAVVIGGVSMDGGKGKILGVVFGVLIFQIISTLTTFAGIQPLLVGVVKGVIILVAVLAQGKEK